MPETLKALATELETLVDSNGLEFIVFQLVSLCKEKAEAAQDEDTRDSWQADSQLLRQIGFKLQN